MKLNLRDIFIGGLLLPLRLYFRPHSFGFDDEIDFNAPEFQRNRNDIKESLSRLADSRLWQHIIPTTLKSLVAMVWVPPILYILSVFGVPIGGGRDIAVRAALGVAMGFLLGVTMGIFYRDVERGAVNAVFGVALGGVLGVTSGVLFGVQLGLTVGRPPVVAAGIAIGVLFGVFISAQLQGMELAEHECREVSTFAALAAYMGGGSGVLIGVFVSKPFHVFFNDLLQRSADVSWRSSDVVQRSSEVMQRSSRPEWCCLLGAEDSVALGVAFGVAISLTITHLWCLPFQSLISLISHIAVKLWPSLTTPLWRISPVRWDEIILPPLPGLSGFLVEFAHFDSQLGRAAINETLAHRHQFKVAERALAVLAREEAERIASLPALAMFADELDWLSDESKLPAATKATWLKIRDISRDVASSLEAESASNRVKQLDEAASKLTTLQQRPGEFRRALARWQELLKAGHEEALQQQRREEPIPQAYVFGGKPIAPANRPDNAFPFKGRRALFRQLEQAVGQAAEPATLLLYGQRRAGKSSVLLQLPRRLGSQVVPAFLDLQSEKLCGAADVAGFLGGLAEEIGEEARRHRELRLPPLDRAALRQDAYPAFGRWLDRVERALDGRRLLLCLDEFEALEEAIAGGRLDARVLAMLRNIVQHRRAINVLLSGSHEISELPPHWAGALVNTAALPVGFLEEADARELITDPVAGFPQIYTPDAVNCIIELTYCQPYLVQLVCGLTVTRLNEQIRKGARELPPASLVTAEDVRGVIGTALERGQGYFYTLWANEIGGFWGQRVLAVLAGARGERLSLSELRRLVADEEGLRAGVDVLLRREIIAREGDDFRLLVPLIAEYARRQSASRAVL